MGLLRPTDGRHLAGYLVASVAAGFALSLMTAVPATAATTAPEPLVLPIPATPFTTAGSITLVLSPPDPCIPGTLCLEVPRVVEITLSPPDPCESACAGAPTTN